MQSVKRALAAFVSLVMCVALLPATAFAANAKDNPSSYAYDQTAARQVTVDVTISSDGIPLKGNDANQTVLSNLSVTVPYFDLALYDMQDYYRYETGSDGSYVGTDPVQRPTALHLYIYLLERYYMGLSEDECCKGALEDVTNDVLNMNDAVAYDSNGTSLCQTGSACSMYMQQFWGHDENLMYYRNHRYPLQREGWGSTADYILLSDGDKIDLAMFTNWDFWTAGSFVCFDADNYTRAEGAEDMTIYTLQTATSAGLDGQGSGLEGFSGAMDVSLYDDNWNEVGTATEGTATAEGDFSGDANHYTLNIKNLEPGTYHIVGLSDAVGDSTAKNAPATATLVIESSAGHVHSLVKHEATTANCGVDGHPDYWECTTCGKTFSDEDGTVAVDLSTVTTPATGDHTWGAYEVTKQPDCNNTGTETSTCSVCGAKRYRTIAPLGHDYSSGTWSWSSDYSSASITLTCATYEVHPKKTVDAKVTSEVTKQPTCTEPGEITYTATLEAGSYDYGDGYCGHWPTLTDTKTVPIPATGHTPVAVDAVSATCTTPGSTAGTKCATCGAVLSGCEAVEATGHQWSAWKTVKASTLFVKGTATRTCSVCGDTEVKALPLVTPKAGMKVTVGGSCYKIANASKRTVKYAGPANKKAKSATVAASVKLQDKAYKVVGITAKAFKGTNVKKVIIKSKTLTKTAVKSCLKGSKVKTVKVPKSKRKAYSKAFSKKNCGKKVTVK